MLYRIAGSDAPLFLRELLKIVELSAPSTHETARLTRRQQKSMFNRLSQGIRQILGLKGQTSSLSIILTQSSIEIGVEMTKETFNGSATAGGEPEGLRNTSSAVLAVDICTCGAYDRPHEPECLSWTKVPELAKFYGVNTLHELVAKQAEHIRKLQSQLPASVLPTVLHPREG